MNPFQSLREYERFVYTLPKSNASIESSTLTIIQKGRYYAELSGEVLFAAGYRLSVYELVTWDQRGIELRSYGYEVWLLDEKLYWYDSQPHPHDPLLASTHPHHKHIPPDIKHHRVPAPGFSFHSPNLPLLLGEIESLLKIAAIAFGGAHDDRSDT